MTTVKYGKPKWADTVSYGMPPEGYDTVTLPVELIDQLDALNNMSRAATVEMLLSEYDDGEEWKQAVSDDGVLEVSLSDGATRRIREGMDTDVPDDLADQLDRIESAATTAEARTGRIEGTLEDMGAGR